MSSTGWLAIADAEVPDGDAWLHPDERAVQTVLRIDKRRREWRMGRFAAKHAVGAWLGETPDDIVVRAADDGAPEAFRHGRRLAVSLSISHRAGRAIAAVADCPVVVGCDLEVVEPRSDAFVAEWLAEADQQRVVAAGPDRHRMANLIWTAKEAAAKVEREGLRLDIRALTVDIDDSPGAWQSLRVSSPDGTALDGWWSDHDGFVMSVVTRPNCGPPRPLHLG